MKRSVKNDLEYVNGTYVAVILDESQEWFPSSVKYLARGVFLRNTDPTYGSPRLYARESLDVPPFWSGRREAVNNVQQHRDTAL